MSRAQRQDTVHGAILFDASAAAQAQDGWFDPAWWQVHGATSAAAGGRGSAWLVEAPFGPCVLRHYRRGGLVARLFGDRYLWTGEERTRAFAEFRLLQALAARGLPVPAPVAARYVRSGLAYRADLLMCRIPQSETLAQWITQGRADDAALRRVGFTIALFHAAGVYHADLNAHNVMLGGDRVHLIDFDRGELRDPAREWQDENLARLKRSLVKVGMPEVETRWGELMKGYNRRLDVADNPPVGGQVGT